MINKKRQKDLKETMNFDDDELILLTHNIIDQKFTKHILKYLERLLKIKNKDDLLNSSHEIKPRTRLKGVDGNVAFKEADVKLSTQDSRSIGTKNANTEPEDAMKSSGSSKSKDVCECCGLIGCEKDNQHKPKTSKGCNKFFKKEDRHCGNKYGYYSDEKRPYVKEKTTFDIWLCKSCKGGGS